MLLGILGSAGTDSRASRRSSSYSSDWMLARSTSCFFGPTGVFLAALYSLAGSKLPVWRSAKTFLNVSTITAASLSVIACGSPDTFTEVSPAAWAAFTDFSSCSIATLLVGTAMGSAAPAG